jgi:translocation and assembly module TamA
MPIRIFHCAFAYLLLLCATGAVAAEPAAAGEEAEFRFRLVVDAPSRLRDTLQSGLDISRWQTYENMTLPLLQSLVRDARAQALEAAATEGYYNARVDLTIEEPQQGMRTVRLQVVPGEPARVANVSIALSDTRDPAAEARVRAQWPLTPGEIFRQPAWENAKSGALAELARTRYVGAAVVESRATVDPGRNTADLALVLDPGPAFAFGPVTVTGLSKYPVATVTYLAPFKPGDPYAREEVEVFLRRLNATNYFASAQVVIDEDRDLADAAPVRVAVIEAPTRRLEAGIGYSTDTLYRALAAWRDVNLFDSAWRLRSELRIESKLQRLGAILELPARSDGWADSFEAAATHTDIQNLVTRGVVIGATRRRVDERRQPAFGLSYYYEQQQPESAPPDLARALFGRYDYTWRTTDDLLFPRAGTVVALRVGVSAPGISTRTFGRVVGQLAWFHAFTRRDDIALRGELGAVLARSAQGIPQALLFRTGGDTTVRGYEFESLGVQKGNAIVGGRYYALASAEYTHWFADTWGVAAFIDAGNAVDQLGGFRFATGYGIGARVKSPIGPFRLDLARGHDTRKIRVHFSVGLAF